MGWVWVGWVGVGWGVVLWVGVGSGGLGMIWNYLHCGSIKRSYVIQHQGLLSKKTVIFIYNQYL